MEDYDTMLRSSEYIKISRPTAVNNKLVAKLDFSTNVKKYFLKDTLVVEYDKNIEDVDRSLLVIPPLFVVAPVAWAAGADIYLETLDQTCLNSLQKIRQVFKKLYPKFSFSGSIHAENLINNKFNNRQKALLFSGGVDSTTSYMRHKDEYPILITLIKGENYSYEYEYYNSVKNAFVNFAKNEGVGIHFIKTDLWDTYSDILDNQLLAHEFEVLDWWMNVSHGLILLGLSAPLTFETIGTLYIASSYERNVRPLTAEGSHFATHPTGCHFLSHTNVSWADIRVIYDAEELTRQEKIEYVLQQNQSYLRNLRVCTPIMGSPYCNSSNSQLYVKNCGSCPKCVLTIAELILEGVDPNECNFDSNDKVLDYVKLLLTYGLLDFRGDQSDEWQDIQDHLPDRIEDVGAIQRYKAKKFFEWFRHFDFSTYKFKSDKQLKMFCWVYCLMKYRGIYDTIKLVTRYSRRSLAVLL